MNQIERLRIKRTLSILVALSMAGIPLSSLSKNLENTNDYNRDNKSYFDIYEEHEESLENDVLWTDIGKKKVKKKKLNQYL